jgi:short-subunit dehydrogenase
LELDPLRVFITGASSGIGEALARHYAARGATLGLFARRETELARVARDLAPARVLPYAGDVRDAAALAAAAAHFVAHTGVPDVVIANAGISTGTVTGQAEDLSAFGRVFDTNVLGIVNTFQPFVAAMRERRSGTLAGIASVAGYRGLPGAAAYSASKAAAISYLEALRVELHGTGVRVVTVSPGYIATPMTARNPYRMPFLMTAEEAAVKIAKLIGRGRSYSVIPWQMAIVARLMRVIPDALYDRLAARPPRKPRRGQ